MFPGDLPPQRGFYLTCYVCITGRCLYHRGFLYQRLVVGAKGIEQFPHLAFWQDLGNLVADGCDFVCRSKPRNVPAAYRGVGDDQLGEESEERDDHLLPM